MSNSFPAHTNEDNYQESLELYKNCKDNSLTLFFYDQLTSPQGTPMKGQPLVKKQSAEEENSSIRSRNSYTSSVCKVRDGNRCLLCGYEGNSTTLEAAHLYEREEFSKTNAADRVNVLVFLGLGEIEDALNKITLCKHCHTQFDSQNVGIQPPGHWIIRDKILEEKTTQGEPFGRFANTRIQFSNSISQNLVKHRFQRYLQKSPASSCLEGKFAEITLEDRKEAKSKSNSVTKQKKVKNKKK